MGQLEAIEKMQLRLRTFHWIESYFQFDGSWEVIEGTFYKGDFFVNIYREKGGYKIEMGKLDSLNNPNVHNSLTLFSQTPFSVTTLKYLVLGFFKDNQ